MLVWEWKERVGHPEEAGHCERRALPRKTTGKVDVVESHLVAA